MHARLPVCPQRQKEVPVRLQRNSANHIRQRRTEKNRQHPARQSKHTVQQRTPNAHLDVVAQLQADATQNQQPQHDHQRQIEAAERRGIEQRKRKVERTRRRPAAKPRSRPTPARCSPSVALRSASVAHQKQMQHPHPQVEPVQHHVSNNHHGNQPEPDKSHHLPGSFHFSLQLFQVIAVELSPREPISAASTFGSGP